MRCFVILHSRCVFPVPAGPRSSRRGVLAHVVVGLTRKSSISCAGLLMFENQVTHASAADRSCSGVFRDLSTAARNGTSVALATSFAAVVAGPSGKKVGALTWSAERFRSAEAVNGIRVSMRDIPSFEPGGAVPEARAPHASSSAVASSPNFPKKALVCAMAEKYPARGRETLRCSVWGFPVRLFACDQRPRNHSEVRAKGIKIFTS